jgi:hypothetical protein
VEIFADMLLPPPLLLPLLLPTPADHIVNTIGEFSTGLGNAAK